MTTRRLITTALLWAVSFSVFANTIAETDILSSVQLEEVLIIASRANEKTPIAFTNVTSEELEKTNIGQDIPYLLSSTPSVITTSDAGMGIGYTSLRVRGTDGSRVNVTTNGVPINDSESHNVYWVNLPDLASSVKDVQNRTKLNKTLFDKMRQLGSFKDLKEEDEAVELGLFAF